MSGNPDLLVPQHATTPTCDLEHAAEHMAAAIFLHCLSIFRYMNYA